MDLPGLIPGVVEDIDHQARRWKYMLEQEPDMLKKSAPSIEVGTNKKQIQCSFIV